jgi:DNA-binding NarL/FixJ family response regulator
MARVFLADCQPLFNEALEALITRDGTNEVVGQASAVPQIVASVPQLKPDLFVLDAGLALSSRPTLVETILAELPDTKVILLAQDTDIDLLLHAIRAGAVGVVGKKSGTQTVLRAVQAVLDGEGVVPRAMLPQLFRRLLDMGDRATDAPLNRLSPREREVLALLGRGWSNAQIGRELYISPHTVRTHVQNILQKLEMHSKLLAALASRMARHTRSGVSGMSMWITPRWATASMTAFWTAGVAPIVPDSPIPLTPSGFSGVGVSVRWVSKAGSSAADGIA